jgi:small subunit ribosomal protein S9
MVTKKTVEKKPTKKVVAVKKPAVHKVKVAEAVAEHKPQPKAELISKKSPATQGKYIYAVGRRKEAKARVRLTETGTGKFLVNERSINAYFPTFMLQDMIMAPLRLTGQDKNHDITVKVVGGGTQGQAEAVRHGISRCLLKWNLEYRPSLKKAGFLKRDPRTKERKKFGLKKARRAPQWAKR